jgi:hypothetical protein
MLIYGITAVLAVLSFFLSGAGQLYAFLGVVVASGIVLFLLTGRDTVQEDLEADTYEQPITRPGPPTAPPTEPSPAAQPSRSAEPAPGGSATPPDAT